MTASTLIVHHWDADGMASAAIVKGTLSECSENVELYTPPIGEYLIEVSLLKREKFDQVYCLDLAFPGHVFLELSTISNKTLIVYDHHSWLPLKRLVKSRMLLTLDERYPSTSWLLSEYLKMRPDFLSVLGAVDDNGSSIVDHEQYPGIKRVLDSLGLTLKDCLSITDLVDASYRVNRREIVTKTVDKILENRQNPKRLLHDEQLLDLERTVKKELERILGTPPDVVYSDTRKKLLFLRFSSTFAVTSLVGCRLTWNSKNCEGGVAAVVVNEGFFKDRDQIYVRTSIPGCDISFIIEDAKKHGYSSGGKHVVASAIAPKNRSQGFIDVIIHKLKEVCDVNA